MAPVPKNGFIPRDFVDPLLIPYLQKNEPEEILPTTLITFIDINPWTCVQ